MIVQRAAVARNNAEMEAATIAIQQAQQNETVVSAAKASWEASKLNAEALVAMAEAECQAMEMRGRMYRAYPELLQVEIAQMQIEALKKCQIIVCADSLTKLSPQQQQQTAAAYLAAQVAMQQ